MKKNALLKYRKQEKSLNATISEEYNKEYSHLFPEGMASISATNIESPQENLESIPSSSNISGNLPFDTLLKPDYKPNKLSNINKKLIKFFLQTKSTIPTLDIPSHSNSPSFLGEIIYDLLYDTKIEKLETRKSVQTKQLHPYIESLLLNSTNISNSFEKRVLYSSGKIFPLI